MTDQDWNQYLESETALEQIGVLLGASKAGAFDPLKAYLKLKAIDAALKAALSEASELAVNEAQKYNGKTFQAFGYEITKKSDPGRWDFKNIQRWKLQKDILSEMEEQHKLAFKMAEKGDKYVTSDGEEIEPAIYTPGRDNISVKALSITIPVSETNNVDRT